MWNSFERDTGHKTGHRTRKRGQSKTNGESFITPCGLFFTLQWLVKNTQPRRRDILITHHSSSETSTEKVGASLALFANVSPKMLAVFSCFDV